MGIFAGLWNLWNDTQEATEFPSDAILWEIQSRWTAQLPFWLIEFPEKPPAKPMPTPLVDLSRKFDPAKYPPVSTPPKFAGHNLALPDSPQKHAGPRPVLGHIEIKNESVALNLRLSRRLVATVVSAIQQDKFSADVDYSIIAPEPSKKTTKRKREVMTPTGQDLSDTDTSVFDGDSEDELPTQSDTSRMDAKAVGQKLFKQYCEKSNPAGSMKPPAKKVAAKRQQKSPS
jgi:hypothetical protein